MVHLACDNGGPPLALSDDAAMLSIHLEEVVGSAGRPMPVMSVDGTLLSRARVAALVALLEGFAELVQHFPADQKVKLRTNGIDHCETCGMVDRGVALLDKFSVNDSALIAQLLGDLRYLDCPLPTTVLAARFAALLRGYDVPTLWSMLNAPNDLSDEEQAKALSEPLFRPVPAEEVPSWEAPGPPSLARSVSISMDGGIPDELSIRTCLTWCDAKTLRSLKAVSSAWRRRARRELGDGHSDWRRAPLWSPSAAAAAHVAALGGLKHQIVAALRELQLVDAAVDLPAHVAAILPLLADGDEDVREAALQTMGKLEAPTLAPHVAAILPLLADRDEDVRQAALQTMGKLEAPTLASHVAAILPLLADGSWGVRQAALQTLGKLEAPTLASHTAAILPLLADGDGDVRQAALQTLGKLEVPTLAPHVAAILLLLADGGLGVRQDVLQTLGKLEAPTLALHVAAILPLLAHEDRHVRQAVLETLGKLEAPTLAPHVAAILPLLADGEWGVRQAALQTLGKLEAPTLAPHVAAILLLLADGEWGVWQAVLETLGKLEAPTLALHVAAILPLLAHEDRHVRQAVLETLGKLEAPTLAPHVAAILPLLADGEWGVRQAVLQTLGKLEAPTLASHVAAILPLLADEDEDVSRAAMKMLRRSGWGGVLQMSWHARGLTMALAGYLLVGPFPAMGLGLGAHFGLSLLPTLSARKRRHDDESQQQSSHKRARVHAAGKWGSG